MMVLAKGFRALGGGQDHGRGTMQERLIEAEENGTQIGIGVRRQSRGLRGFREAGNCISGCINTRSGRNRSALTSHVRPEE